MPATTESALWHIAGLPTPTLTLASSSNPSTYLQSVTFTATISPSVSGTITFYENGASIGTATISSGVATLSTSALTAGTQQITASWPGNGSYGPVTSSPLAQVVNKATPTLSVSSSLNPSNYGQSVTFTATAGFALSGTVTFYSNGTSIIRTCPISGTSTTFSTSTLAGGTDSITASWPGDSNTNSVTSSPLSQVVNKVTPTLNLASSVNPSNYGQSVTFTVTSMSRSAAPLRSLTARRRLELRPLTEPAPHSAPALWLLAPTAHGILAGKLPH